MCDAGKGKWPIQNRHSIYELPTRFFRHERGVLMQTLPLSSRYQSRPASSQLPQGCKPRDDQKHLQSSQASIRC